MNIEPNSTEKVNDSFILPDQSNAGSQENLNNTDNIVKEHEAFIPLTSKISNNKNEKQAHFETPDNNDTH